MAPDNAQHARPTDGLRWRLTPGIQIHARGWAGETTVYFAGAGETMVIDGLGAAAIGGILAGCENLPALEDWCRARGFSDAAGLDAGLLALIEKLAEYEIIEPAP